MWRHKLPFRRAAAFSIVGYAATDEHGTRPDFWSQAEIVESELSKSVFNPWARNASNQCCDSSQVHVIAPGAYERIDQTPISYTVTREAIMALTSTEKQQRYHVRHLGRGAHSTFHQPSGKSKTRTPCCHYGYTVTEVIEDLEVEAHSSAGVRPRPNVWSRPNVVAAGIDARIAKNRSASSCRHTLVAQSAIARGIDKIGTGELRLRTAGP
jgi:hypothetical protein